MQCVLWYAIQWFVFIHLFCQALNKVAHVMQRIFEMYQIERKRLYYGSNFIGVHFIQDGSIDKNAGLVQAMAWRRTGDKILNHNTRISFQNDTFQNALGMSTILFRAAMKI